LVVANSADNTVSVLLGKGNGTFAAKVDYATGQAPSSLAIADLNGDGKLDLVVTNFTDGTVSILKGNGDGTFQMHVDHAANGSPGSVAVADFNHDQKPDLVLVNSGPFGASPQSISVLLGNGDGTFQSPVSYTAMTSFPAFPQLSSLAVADLNADGTPDVVVTSHEMDTTFGVYVFLGKGDGTLSNATGYALDTACATCGAYSVAIADLNRDGKLDLAVSAAQTTTFGGPGTVTILIGNGDGTFAVNNGYLVSQFFGSIVAGDFNSDGNPDIAVTGNNSVSVLLGAGDGGFTSLMQFGTGSRPSSLVAGDFNSDGHLDLATADYNIASVGVLFGNGDGSFQTRSDYQLDRSAVAVAAGDFNGDGKPDLITVDSSGDPAALWLGNGDGTFQESGPFAFVDASDVLVADFNGDGKLDVAAADLNGSVTVILGNGDGTFQKPTDYPAGPTTLSIADSVALGDFNGDGKPDLVWVHWSAGGGILMNNGDGTFTAGPSFGVSGFSVAVGDFNGDGKADLAIADRSNISLLIGNGNGTFQTGVSYATGSGPTGLAAGDLNHDGKIDLVALNSSNSISVLLGNGDGTFQTHVDYPTWGAFPASTIKMGDLHGDGNLDVVVLGEFGLSVFKNTGDANLQVRTDYGTATAPGGVALADFNLDGRLDAVSVNEYSPFAQEGMYGAATFSVLLNGQGAIISIMSSKNPSDAGAPVTLTATVNPVVPGTVVPTGTVSLQQGTNSLGTATLNGNGAVFSVPPLSAGVYSISAHYSGDPNFFSSNSAFSQVVNAPKFSVTASAFSPASLAAGQSSSSTVTITSVGGFSGSVAITCAVSPSPANAPSCSLTPGSLQSSGDGSVTSMLNVQTTAPHTAAFQSSSSKSSSLLAAFCVSFFGLFVVSLKGETLVGNNRNWRKLIWVASFFALLMVQSACGGGSSHGTPTGGTPSGNYTITIQAVSGSTQQNASAKLTVQ
jgi:hypothetical protein